MKQCFFALTLLLPFSGFAGAGESKPAGSSTSSNSLYATRSAGFGPKGFSANPSVAKVANPLKATKPAGSVDLSAVKKAVPAVSALENVWKVYGYVKWAYGMKDNVMAAYEVYKEISTHGNEACPTTTTTTKATIVEQSNDFVLDDYMDVSDAEKIKRLEALENMIATAKKNIAQSTKSAEDIIAEALAKKEAEMRAQFEAKLAEEQLKMQEALNKQMEAFIDTLKPKNDNQQ